MKKVYVMGADQFDSSLTTKIKDEIIKASNENAEVVFGNPNEDNSCEIPIQEETSIVYDLIKPSILSQLYYRDDRRKIKSWERPYKYHK